MESSKVALVQKLQTGDVMVFDKQNRDLFLIEASAAKGFDTKVPDPTIEAKRLVGQGRAMHLDRRLLERLQAALSGIVLLGA